MNKRIFFKFEGSVGALATAHIMGLLMVLVQTIYAPSCLAFTFGEDTNKRQIQNLKPVLSKVHIEQCRDVEVSKI